MKSTAKKIEKSENSKIIEKLNKQIQDSAHTSKLQKEMARLNDIITQKDAANECSCVESTEYVKLQVISEWHFVEETQELEMQKESKRKRLCTPCLIEKMKSQDEDFQFPRRGTR